MGHIGLLHILYLILPFKKIETILSSQAITQWATAGLGGRGVGHGLLTAGLAQCYYGELPVIEMSYVCTAHCSSCVPHVVSEQLKCG